MATEKLVVIKEMELSNNCPECFNQDLKLTFYQRHYYGNFIHRTTSDVTNQILCNKCGSDIYPSKWTDDIERIFNYYQKTAVPEKSSLKFTALFYILILIVLALIGGGVYVYLEGLITI